VHFFTKDGQAQPNTLLSHLVDSFRANDSIDWPVVDSAIRRNDPWLRPVSHFQQNLAAGHYLHALRQVPAKLWARAFPRHTRFAVLQREADGLLSPGIYERLYDQVRTLPDLDIVEVGGAAGAASVASDGR
jgi:hypothetical protein